MPIGIGAVYWPALHPLFEKSSCLLDFLEVEPQAFWHCNAGTGPRYLLDRAAFQAIRALPQHKIVHSVGCPVGGTHLPEEESISALVESIQLLDAQWASEHLSFSAYESGSGPRHAGFLLPPCQSTQGVATAVANIRLLQRSLPVPIAFETGVNYLRPLGTELHDGAYFREVADAADCGILLDLHNLWANEINGRVTLDDVLTACPLDRVWEVHVAGGFRNDGYYLDAHRGPVSDALMDILARWIGRMPNVRAVIYEILPEHIASTGIDEIEKQLRALREAVTQRDHACKPSKVTVPSNKTHCFPAAPQGASPSISGARPPSPDEWERKLVEQITAASATEFDTAGSLEDPALRVYRDLIRRVRQGRFAEHLRLTCTLIALSAGPEVLRAVVDDFIDHHPTSPWPMIEADQFAHYLLHAAPRIDYLNEVLRFEHAVIEASLYGRPTEVVFSTDPSVLLGHLADGSLPAHPQPGVFSVSVGTSTVAKG